MRWRRSSIATVAALLALGLAAGCVESEPDAAQTPEAAETVVNSALQTDSMGMTVTAPAPGGEGGEMGGGEMGGGEMGGGEGDVEAAVSVFTSASPACSTCHTLEAAGSTANIGPNLDESLEGQPADYVREAIVNPDGEVAEGFGPGIMPPYDTLPEEDLELLVSLLTP